MHILRGDMIGWTGSSAHVLIVHAGSKLLLQPQSKAANSFTSTATRTRDGGRPGQVPAGGTDHIPYRRRVWWVIPQLAWS